jgi:outer membrane immunogenic protein
MLRTILISGLATALLGGAALAADLPTRKAAPAFVPPAPVVSWTGFYIGVNGGYAGDQFKYPFSGYYDPYISGGGSANLTSSGFLGGLQAGYNWQFASSWVAGAEADIDATSITGKVGVGASGLYGTNPGVPVSGSFAAKSEQPYLATLRARLGYLVTDRFLAFATGGLAFGDVKSSVSATASLDGNAYGPYTYSKTTNHTGWTLGAGVEYMINKNWTFKTEYLYVDLGSQTLLSGSGEGYAYSLKVHPTDNIVRAGLNYKFD